MNDKLIKRKAIADLLGWFKAPNRKPLILRGARQVGKSTTVQEFARSAGLKLYELNLERHLHLDSAFSSLSIQKILIELEGVLKQRLSPEGSLLFLDEIQATPHGLAALRYFYEETEFAVIAAGSLLEFALGRKGLSMPVGRVEYFYLGPLSFEEFLLALGEDYLIELIQTASLPEQVSTTAHQKLTALHKEYLLVGGLPEAVAAYSRGRSFTEVQRVHAAISETYQDDFIKYAASGRLQLLQQLFREIPRTLGNKVKFSNLSRQYSATVVHQNVDLLIKAGVVQPIYHSPCSGVPIAAQIDQSSFKLLCLDVGLMNHICGINWSELSNMSELQLINSGGVAEQFIGQHLLYHRSNNLRPELYYWLREGRKGNAEVDYVMQLGNQILPIEVKAGKSGSLKSLFQFASRRDIKKAVRFDLNPPSRQIVQHAASSVGSDRVSFELISLPLYMVGQWQRWI